MGNWKEVLDEAKQAGSTHDLIRKKYLKRLQQHTKRNVIAYYSGWLQKPHLGPVPIFSIGDADMTGFMASIHRMKADRGLDLLLHTPGGSLAATEALVTYLRAKFGADVRVIVPQLAMSAGSMISLASREIVMGKHSSLGPIDPQVNGVPAHGIVEEFETAIAEASKNPARAPFWGAIIGKYNPTLIGECKKAIEWSEQLVTDWLTSGMLAGEEDRAALAAVIVKELGDHALTKTHGRHYSLAQVQQLGIKVKPLEDDDRLQELVLSYHHATIQTFAATNAVKIIENHRGISYIEQVLVQAK